ncbi:ATP-dependent DNA helicase [Candidatus Woesearchaeota archaeon]|nr:ATP-dependent DNA helicase [Candidatus Woesearchaeota archaeon]
MHLLFPHDHIRENQKDLVNDVTACLEQGNHLIAHAPTGLGKTAATLAPALSYALQEGNKHTIFFLTSRHTQHAIAVETIKKIKQKHNLKIQAVDLIGKKWMCLVKGVELLSSGEFSEFCKSEKEEMNCGYYANTRQKGKFTTNAKVAMEHLEPMLPLSVKEQMNHCSTHSLCPYELTLGLAAKAKIIIADYYYLFHPSIRDIFLQKIDKTLADSIVIVDEGHNLPNRLMELMSQQLSTAMLQRAAKEAKKFHATSLIPIFEHMHRFLAAGKEEKISKEIFMDAIKSKIDYDQLIDDLTMVAKRVREEQKGSSLGSMAAFLEAWQGQDEGFVRYIKKERNNGFPNPTLFYKCLDPSLLSQGVINECRSCILMSGTLHPTEMYRDVLGFPKETLLKTYPSPFPEENRLNLIIPEVSTKYQERSEKEFKRIAAIILETTAAVKGNTAAFFPSYEVMEAVSPIILSHHPHVIKEQPNLSNEEKEKILESFKSLKDKGALLLGVAAANFSEGIDLPGDLLKCVMVVGLPLQPPDTETMALIDYYDKKYHKGWEYGYIYPGFNKSLQSAGRCIRTENDKGVIIFLDKRYLWQNYRKCFPQDWKIKVSSDHVQEISQFFAYHAL